MQVGFISFFVLPLIQVYAKVEATKSSSVIQQTVEQNLRLWRMLDKISKEKILEYLGPAVSMLTPAQLKHTVEQLLCVKKIRLTVRSVN